MRRDTMLGKFINSVCASVCLCVCVGFTSFLKIQGYLRSFSRTRIECFQHILFQRFFFSACHIRATIASIHLWFCVNFVLNIHEHKRGIISRNVMVVMFDMKDQLRVALLTLGLAVRN